MRFKALWLFVAALLAAGCGETLETEGGEAPAEGPVETVREGALQVTTVQAVDEEAWVGLRLAASATHVDPEASSEWHLRLRRIAVGMQAGVEAQTVEGSAADFEAFSRIEGGEWLTEPPADAEPVGRGRPTGPLGGWFDYNPMNHTVSPGERFYALRTPDGGCFKLRFEGYYDEAGTAGVVRFRWGALEGCR